MHKYDMERAVEKGIKRGLREGGPSRSAEGAFFLMALVGLASVLMLGLLYKSWVLFFIGVAVIAVGLFVFPYVLGFFVPTAWMYFIVAMVLRGHKEDGLEFTVFEAIVDFTKSLGLLYLFLLALSLYTAKKVKG